ncbi:MAG: hypothetical protein AB7J30_12590 [Hyphomicrobium sp.]|uniref:hypothetical protein n=1 Tax=Hyphomicrobium sp. TaxID=82 RepID=UPI003D0B8175
MTEVENLKRRIAEAEASAEAAEAEAAALEAKAEAEQDDGAMMSHLLERERLHGVARAARDMARILTGRLPAAIEAEQRVELADLRKQYATILDKVKAIDIAPAIEAAAAALEEATSKAMTIRNEATEIAVRIGVLSWTLDSREPKLDALPPLPLDQLARIEVLVAGLQEANAALAARLAHDRRVQDAREAVRKRMNKARKAGHYALEEWQRSFGVDKDGRSLAPHRDVADAWTLAQAVARGETIDEANDVVAAAVGRTWRGEARAEDYEPKRSNMPLGGMAMAGFVAG